MNTDFNYASSLVINYLVKIELINFFPLIAIKLSINFKGNLSPIVFRFWLINHKVYLSVNDKEET